MSGVSLRGHPTGERDRRSRNSCTLESETAGGETHGVSGTDTVLVY